MNFQSAFASFFISFLGLSLANIISHNSQPIIVHHASIPRNDPPKFSSHYEIEGVLRLPYAELEEPFKVWFDGPNTRSRIDYYGGMTKTYQRGDIGQYGITQKVFYKSTYQVTNELTCLQIGGSGYPPLLPQTVLPDVSGMKYVHDEVVGTSTCAVWREVQSVGFKNSTFTLWVDINSGAPVRYEMMGYDSLFGSHYDKYILDYTQYMADVSIPVSTFEIKDVPCTESMAPEEEHHITMNPMREFVHNIDDHTQNLFSKFVNTHARVYSGEDEHLLRMHTFRQHVRFIFSKNRAGLSYTLAVNRLSDRTGNELRQIRGFRRVRHASSDSGHSKHRQAFNHSEFAERPAPPDQVDWRLQGAVTPVKDQAVCGSCWSFGTTGTIEGSYFLKTGYQVRLSQQELVDCSWGEGNNGCDGGEDVASYKWIIENGGLSSEEEYGHYLAVDGKCHSKAESSPTVKMSGYVQVDSFNQTALSLAIAYKGPISVAIDAAHKTLSFYSHGVYYEPACGSAPDDLDHAVLAVGYGEMSGHKYWLIKNSWSTYWGNDGYFMISQEGNNCGVATMPSYPILK